MNYDDEPPFNLDEYREMQRSIPGVDGLYRLLRAVLEARVAPGGRILIVGAGGGRELETLGPSAHGYRFTAVDPSTKMIAAARACAEAAGATGRTAFVTGETKDAPAEPHDAATSLLVMHFLSDDGAKLAFLREIRARLRAGATLVHADVSFAGPEAFEKAAPIFLRHAELAGLPAEKAAIGPRIIRDMPIIGKTRTAELMAEAGFGDLVPVFRGLWYATWMCEAV